MKKETASENQKMIDSYDYLGSACSALDCTGLIPAGITDPEELNSYEAIYPFRPPALKSGSLKTDTM
jgi:hypothetical protein